MTSDFAVVINVRHRFGDQREDQGFEGDHELLDVDVPAPFVGRVGTFDFSCPDIDGTKQAILQFHYRGSEQGAAFPVLNAGDGLIGLVDDNALVFYKTKGARRPDVVTGPYEH